MAPSAGDFLRSVAPVWLPEKNNLSGLQRINFFTDFVRSGCAGVKHLSVETIFPAALEAAIAIVDFDELDVFRFIFRPRGLFRNRHLRGKGGLRSAARKSSILAALQDAKYSNGTRTLWRWDTIGQRILFWFMVWDIASDFVYNWSSLAANGQSCGGGSAGKKSPGGTLFTLGTWQGGDFGTVLYESDNVTAFGTGFNVISKGGSASGAIGGTNISPVLPVTLGIRATHTGPNGVTQNTDFNTIPPGGSGDVVVTLFFDTPGVVVFETKTVGFGINIRDGDAFVVGRE